MTILKGRGTDVNLGSIGLSPAGLLYILDQYGFLYDHTKGGGLLEVKARVV